MTPRAPLLVALLAVLAAPALGWAAPAATIAGTFAGTAYGSAADTSVTVARDGRTARITLDWPPACAAVDHLVATRPGRVTGRTLRYSGPVARDLPGGEAGTAVVTGTFTGARLSLRARVTYPSASCDATLTTVLLRARAPERPPRPAPVQLAR